MNAADLAHAPQIRSRRLYDANGDHLSPTRAVARGKRYRYDVSQALLQHREDEAGAVKCITALAPEGGVVKVFMACFRWRPVLMGREKSKITDIGQQSHSD